MHVNAGEYGNDLYKGMENHGVKFGMTEWRQQEEEHHIMNLISKLEIFDYLLLDFRNIKVSRLKRKVQVI